MDIFHELIKKERRSAGLSQEEIADRMGIQRSTYGNFERGKTNLISPMMYRFATALGKTPEEIWGLEAPGTMHGYLQESTLEDRLEVLEDRMDTISRQLGVLITEIEILSGKVGKK